MENKEVEPVFLGGITPEIKGEVERVREKIAHLPVTMPSSLPKQFVGTDLANQILAIKGLRIEAYDQSLPDKVMVKFILHPDYAMASKAGQSVAETATMAYSQAQQDMRNPDKDGCVWVKVIPEEAKEKKV